VAELIVGPEGSAAHATIQAAIDAATGPEPVTIRVGPGRYREVVKIPRGGPPIRLVGATGDARDAVITFDNASRTKGPDGTPYGTSGSATLTVEADGFVACDLTVENAYRREGDPTVRDQQAVALKVEADRVELRNVRLIGRQDTLYANATAGRIARQYYRECHIEGDVDFIFGSATAVFDRCTIRVLGRGWVTAASTAATSPRGFLIVRSRVETDGPLGSARLGRPWHPGGDLNAIAHVVVRDSWLGPAIAAAPWTDMSGFSWKAARFFEYRNTGPGAGSGASRPQLDAAVAASFTAAAYLAGADGWDPIARA